jgi:hypothetical protein
MLRRLSGRTISAISLLSASLPLLLLLVIPVYRYERCRLTFGEPTANPQFCERGAETLTQVEGAGVWRILAVPATIAGIAVGLGFTRFGRVARGTAAFLLGVMVLLGALSIGILYVPAFAVMIWAASRD